MADGVKSSLDRLELVVFRSVLATVAARHRKSASWAKKHLRMGSDHGVTVMVEGKPCHLKLWKLKQLKLEPWRRAAVDSITVGARLAQSGNDLVARLKACRCELCGDRKGPFEMHHDHALKDKRGAPFTAWKQSARQRRTIALCRRCHVTLHADRRASRAESRVH